VSEPKYFNRLRDNTNTTAAVHGNGNNTEQSTSAIGTEITTTVNMTAQDSSFSL